MILFTHLLIALLFALLFTAIFAAGLRKKGPWASLVLFFVIIFLATWAGGIWLHPIGRPVWGVHWMAFLFVGLVIALILAATVPGRQEESSVELVDPNKERAEKKAALGALGILFWVLMVALIVAIIARYVLYDVSPMPVS
jgi:hypothetical protein